MSQNGDKETTDDDEGKPSSWDSTTETEDSEGTDFSARDVPQIQRLDSQQSSSVVSFKSDCSDSEQNYVSTDRKRNRKRQKKFTVQMKTAEGTCGIAVNASDTEMFIEQVKAKASSKCQGRNIDCLLLETDKDNHIPLEKDNVEFDFLKLLGHRLVTVIVQSSPIKHKVKLTMTPIVNLGKLSSTGTS